MADKYKKVAGPTKYGIKAYGKWDYFNTAKELKAYLMDWIGGTEGAEQDRAVTALFNAGAGIYLTDTDAA